MSHGGPLMRFIHLYPHRLLRPRHRSRDGACGRPASSRTSAAMWVAIGTIIVVGLGIMLAVTSGKPDDHAENKRADAARDAAARRPALPFVCWHRLAVASRHVVTSGTSYGSVVPAMRVAIAALALAVLAATAACKESGTIKVHSLSFKGVKAVDESRLKDALATHQSSKIPWGKKYFFDRSRFDADLKRIQAFYADRGYPDARVTGFDVKLNDKQDEVDLTVTIAEGDPVLVQVDRLHRLRRDSGGAPRRSEEARAAQGRPAARPPARRQHPRDGGQRAEGSRLPLRARWRPAKTTAADGKQATLTFTAEPGKLAHFGAVEVVGNKSVDEHIIRRRADLQAGRAVSAQRRPGFAAAAVRPRAVPVREHRAAQPGTAARGRAGPRDRRRGQPPADQFRRRLRHRGEGARRRRVSPRQFLRRRAHRRRARPLVVARSRRAARLQPAVFLPAALLARRRRRSSGTPTRRPTARPSSGGKVTLTHRAERATPRGRCRSPASTTAA